MTIEKFLKNLERAAQASEEDLVFDTEVPSVVGQSSDSPPRCPIPIPSNRSHWILPVESAQAVWSGLSRLVKSGSARCHNFTTSFSSWDEFFDYLDSNCAKPPIFWAVSDSDLTKLGGLMLTPPSAWAQALHLQQHLVLLTRNSELLRVPALLAAGGFSRACLHTL